ncbi:MAG: ECF transporter S component [Clostridia bacterium]|nr:ECF transporter S component [Clostridia bacterium]
MRKEKVQRVIFSALFSALICVATMVVKIPTPFHGYVNLGDCIVLLAAWSLPMGYGFLSAGLGSALADLLSGYVAYAPATFIIKGIMVVVVNVVMKLCNSEKKYFTKGLAGSIAEVVMVAGYYIFEGVIYGFKASVVNILPNVFQGICSLLLAVLIAGVLEKYKFEKLVLKR